MTPSMITLLVIAGIVLLIAIGYINHVVENNELEKARLKVEFNDRIRRCSEVNETFPGQMMSPGLKLLLTRLELNATQRLLLLNKASVPLKARVAELEALVAKGDSIPVNNPPRPILTEAKAKDARFLLETLHGQVTRAAKDRVLASNEAEAVAQRNSSPASDFAYRVLQQPWPAGAAAEPAWPGTACL